ncbi:MAG: 2-aminoethylphosphonate--pyruvate transaminase [Planctomycetes bacterium]|nr:2-aminoethylphosphonate--pyruvate transaminase [Planctomycetota bacterium]
MTDPAPPDKPLFTPGPLTTSRSVKEAMLRDLGSRDSAFVDTVRQVRDGLLSLAGVSTDDGYEAILVQGAGTFGLEAVISSALPPKKKLLAVINGAYGERIATIAEVHDVEVVKLCFAENTTPEVGEIERLLDEDPTIATVAVVHCETTTGIMNPVHAIGRVVSASGRTFFVDSMSAFGAIDVDVATWGIDFLVSSANKCIEGVPGFSFVICRREALLATKGWGRTVSLDLLAQWKGLEANGQFRFTPPTHAILAFHQALQELNAEGGVEGRSTRYRENHVALVQGMRALGFQEYLPSDVQGPIITSFLYPDHDAFTFEEFYERLNNRGFVIYPGKVTQANCFRIGTIGRLYPDDIGRLLAAIEATLSDMGVR